jgi:hypothetical protein
MADDQSKTVPETVNCMILEGPKGALYLISDETFQSHRLPDEVAVPLCAAYGIQARKSGAQPDASAAAASFQILGQRPVVRRGIQTVPTMDTWWDMMTAPQPGDTQR